MRATATFLLPDGTRRTAGHGDVIGRLTGAAIHLDDARVSEAHAMVSLRGSDLTLLALRGRFAIDGKALEKAVLQPGLTVYLARDLSLDVVDVSLPAHVLGLRGPRLPTRMLPGVGSLVLSPEPAVVGRYVSRAAATFWTTGEGWRYRIGDGEAGPLEAGTTLTIDGATYEAVHVSLSSAGLDATVREGRLQDPLHLVAMHDSVQIHCGQTALALSGLAARILSELAEIGLPVAWHAVAEQLWDGEREDIRKRWDLTLSRLRKRLREAGIRQDLVVPDGHGNVQLLLYPEDRCEVQP